MSLAKLQKRMRELSKQARAMNVGAVVGFGARHALVVHEDLSMEHKPGKQGKYLEGPARQFSKQIFDTITDEYKRTENPKKAIMAGANLLKRESQKIVPVDTGALRASAYACLEEDHEEVAAQAADRAEKILGASK